MLLPGIIIIVISISVFVGIMATTCRDDKENVLMMFFVTIFFLLGVLFIIGFFVKDRSEEKSLKEYSYKTEIRSEMTNGIETSRDTVYIFIPKSKDK